jgi:hypothetical protein
MNNASDLWFDDGNLVLEVGDKKFKIYKGLLARASPIFRGMFEISSSECDNGSMKLEDDPEGTQLVMQILHGIP